MERQFSELPYGLDTMSALYPYLKMNLEFDEESQVIDVGCGRGFWLQALLEKGHNAKKLYGVDQYPVDDEFIPKPVLFMQEDFSLPLWKEETFGSSYDLVISVEVAEHLPESRANDFIRNLTTLGDTILFSAAIPGQDGVNHVNEQWPTYWIGKFDGLGYEVFDFLRWRIWNDKHVAASHKNNLLLFVKRGTASYNLLLKRLTKIKFDWRFRFAIHPELYGIKTGNILNGKTF